MKEKLQHIIQQSTVLFVVLAFLLPTAVSFGHSLQGHEHFDTCKVTSDVHIHENDIDCELGDFQVIKMVGQAFAKAKTLPTTIFSKQVFRYTSVNTITPNYNFTSRGPPAS